MGFGFDKRKLRIVFVCGVECVTIFTLEVDEGLLKVILIDLRFRDKDEVGEVVGGEVLEAVDIAGKALKIPCQDTKRYNCRSINSSC